MFRSRLRRLDPFAAALVVFATAFALLCLFIACFNPPAGALGLIAAAIILAHAVVVQRSVRE